MPDSGVHRYDMAFTGGLSLVELLVAMLLGVILSAGMVSAYLTARQNYVLEEQEARMQENGRYAMRLLTRELGMAGFFGGLPKIAGTLPASVGNDCSDTDWVLDGTNAVELSGDYTGQGAPVSSASTTFTCLDAASIAPDTDLLAIKRTAGEASLREGVIAAGLSESSVQSWYLEIEPENPAKWERMDSGNLRDAAQAMSPGSYWKAITRIFFIRREFDSDGQEEGASNLCMETLAGDGMTMRCLVEGVENMQFEFGIDSDGDGVPNQYKSSPTGAEMQHAVVAKIHLLVRSLRRISGYKDEKSYSLGQKHLAARHDAYLRRVYSSTVVLRNRMRPI